MPARIPNLWQEPFSPSRSKIGKSDAAIPKSDREKVGLKDSLIRLSVSIEDVDDLIYDLAGALR